MFLENEPPKRAIRRTLLFTVFGYLFFAPIIGKLIGMEGETIRTIIQTGGTMIMVCLPAYFAMRAYEGRDPENPPAGD